MRNRSVENHTSFAGEIVFYHNRVEVHLDRDTVWLSQAQMAILFDKDVRTINEHIQNIYDQGELKQRPTIRKSRIVAQEGNRSVSRIITSYNEIGDGVNLTT